MRAYPRSVSGSAFDSRAARAGTGNSLSARRGIPRHTTRRPRSTLKSVSAIAGCARISAECIRKEPPGIGSGIDLGKPGLSRTSRYGTKRSSANRKALAPSVTSCDAHKPSGRRPDRARCSPRRRRAFRHSQTYRRLGPQALTPLDFSLGGAVWPRLRTCGSPSQTRCQLRSLRRTKDVR